jgi:hypothetical protein
MSHKYLLCSRLIHIHPSMYDNHILDMQNSFHVRMDGYVHLHIHHHSNLKYFLLLVVHDPLGRLNHFLL